MPQAPTLILPPALPALRSRPACDNCRRSSRRGPAAARRSARGFRSGMPETPPVSVTRWCHHRLAVSTKWMNVSSSSRSVQIAQALRPAPPSVPQTPPRPVRRSCRPAVRLGLIPDQVSIHRSLHRLVRRLADAFASQGRLGPAKGCDLGRIFLHYSPCPIRVRYRPIGERALDRGTRMVT